MLNFRYRSSWEFDTSSSGGAGLGAFSVGAGSLYFNLPGGGQAIFGYVAGGLGASIGAVLPDDMTVSYSDKSMTNVGSLWLTPGFNGTELAPDDLTGFCTIQEVSSAMGSGQILFLGISFSDIVPEAGRDVFSFSPVAYLTDYILDKADLDWPEIFKSKANAALVIAGFGNSTTLFGATGSVGRVFLSGMKSARIVSPPIHYNHDLPIKITYNGKENMMEITNDVLFDFDKDNLKPTAAKVLTEIAAHIKTFQPKNLTIFGYADSIGNDAYNVGLSARRATRVRDWLVSKGGVEASKIFTMALGEYNPKASNKTAAGRAQNRRVEIRLFK